MFEIVITFWLIPFDKKKVIRRKFILMVITLILRPNVKKFFFASKVKLMVNSWTYYI